MWFEGETTPVLLPEVIKNALLTPDPSLPTPTPLWEMVSSNVGTTINDDGYVFYSKGKTGKDNIFIGLKNYWASNDAAKWFYGHKYFITESYTPNSTTDINGVFGRTYYEGLRYHNDATSGGVTASTLRINYFINVNADRVIIVVRSPLTVANITSVIYLGLINRYFDETDSSAVAIATNYGYLNNYINSIRLLRAKSSESYGFAYGTSHGDITVTGNKGWGNRFLAVPITISSATEGVRGELEDILITRYTNDITKQGRNVPEFGAVLVNGKEYLCAVKKYNYLTTQDNFANTSVDFALLIPKE